MDGRATATAGLMGRGFAFALRPDARGMRRLRKIQGPALIFLKAGLQRQVKMLHAAQRFQRYITMNKTQLSALRRRLGWAGLSVALITLPLPLPLAAQANAEPVPGDYRVVKGKVDRGTYTGWRLFHTTCHGCHGVDAVGTDLAPNLVQGVKTLTPREFATKVMTSYRTVLLASDMNTEERSAVREAMVEEIMRRERGARGQVTMPAWEADPKVKPHVLDLYAYLSARADGKLGPGEPKLLAGSPDLMKPGRRPSR